MIAKQNNVVFDIGANIGDYTEYALKAGATQVVAVEPNPVLTDQLKCRFLGQPVWVVNKAVSDQPDKINFYLSNTSTLSTATRDWIEKSRFAKQHRWQEPIQVDTVTLDKLIELYGEPDFIKIDVEGYELSVLRSLTHKVNTVLAFEWAEELISKTLSCIDYLVKLGYTQYAVTYEDHYENRPIDFYDAAAIMQVLEAYGNTSRKVLWGMIYVQA